MLAAFSSLLYWTISAPILLAEAIEIESEAFKSIKIHTNDFFPNLIADDHSITTCIGALRAYRETRYAAYPALERPMIGARYTEVTKKCEIGAITKSLDYATWPGLSDSTTVYTDAVISDVLVGNSTFAESSPLVMVLGGNVRFYKAEVVAVEDGFTKTAPMNTVANIPEKLEGAISGLVQRPGLSHLSPAFCGGKNLANNQRWSKCYYYDFTSNTWPEMGSLPVPTYVAAGDYHKNWGLVITGGYSGTYLDTAYYTLDGDTFHNLASLPRVTERHCAAIIDHEKLIIFGGRNGRKTLHIYRKSTRAWESGLPSASVSRDHCMCAGADSPDGSGRELVVAGGNVGLSYHNSAEVYSFSKKTWRSVANMPQVRIKGYAVPYGNTFVLVGGWGWAYHKKVVKYDAANEAWIELGDELPTGGEFNFAVQVDAAWFPPA